MYNLFKYSNLMILLFFPKVALSSLQFSSFRLSTCKLPSSERVLILLSNFPFTDLMEGNFNESLTSTTCLLFFLF
jgi:hypothetical protein